MAEFQGVIVISDMSAVSLGTETCGDGGKKRGKGGGGNEKSSDCLTCSGGQVGGWESGER